MWLAISTGSVFPFLGSKGKQVKFLSSCVAQVDGIELILAKPRELMKLNSRGQIAKQLKEFSFVNLHFPFGKHIRRSGFSEKALVAKALELDKELNFRHVVVHPNAVKDWRLFKESGLPILLENPEADSKNRRHTPFAMEKILDKTGFGFCLDLNHAMSCGIRPVEFLKLKGRIKQVHVNATELFGKEAQHNFLCGSSKKTVGMVKPVLKQLKNVVWVIEARAEKNPKKKIEREICFLMKLA